MRHVRLTIPIAVVLMLAVVAPVHVADAKPAVTKKAATKKAARKKSAPKAAAAAVPATPDQIVERARARADAGRIDEALAMVRDARTKYPDDVGLQWMEAGLVGRTGDHRAAVNLYEALLAVHPEMARDLRMDLATERLWAGDTKDAIRDYDLRLQEEPADEDAKRMRAMALAFDDRHAESVAAYDELLAAHPGDVELMLGRAQALAWGGRHAQAADAYREVLGRDSTNAQARLGAAWNDNWSGRHREAAGEFQAMLADSNPEPEAWKGLAWAEYWSGRHDKAVEPLAKYRALRPDDREGAELQRLLAREFDPGLTVGHDWSSDTDNLTIFTLYAEYRFVTDPRGVLTLHWRRDNVDDDGGRFEPYRVGIGYQRILTDLWSAHGALWAYKPGVGREPRGMGEAGLTFRPADLVTFDFGYAREPVLTRLSIDRDIELQTGSAAVTWNARPRITLDAATAILHWSDENDGQRTSAGARYQLTNRPRFGAALTAGYQVLMVDRDTGNGYYAPGRDTEWGPGVDLRWNPKPEVTVGCNARIGWQEERGLDTEVFHNVLVSLGAPLGRFASFYVEYESSDSNLGSASGFEQNRWASYVNVPF